MLGGGLAMAAPRIPNRLAGAGAMLLGTGLNVAGGVISGSERRARMQADEVPREPVSQSLRDMSTPQIAQGYQDVSRDYTSNNFGPQGMVTSMLRPTAENAHISQTLHDRVRGTPSFQPPDDSH